MGWVEGGGAAALSIAGPPASRSHSQICHLDVLVCVCHVFIVPRLSVRVRPFQIAVHLISIECVIELITWDEGNAGSNRPMRREGEA